ncbi:ABC transporter [Hypomontagnella monticulosa]|nr:ABC transporter [Hypomontagnella monticulosa]
MAFAKGSADLISGFSILLSVLFICSALLRLWNLRRTPTIVNAGFQGQIKTVLSVLLITSNFGHFFTLESSTLNRGHLRVVARALELVAAVVLCILSGQDHRKSIRPSDLVILYLIGCVIRDGLEVPWAVQGSRDWLLQDPIVAQMVIEVALLATESIQKDYAKESSHQDASSEESSGILSKIFFWWINPILYEGYHNILVGSDLPSIDSKLLSRSIRIKALNAWERRSKPEDKMTLPKVLFASLVKPFMLVIPARLFLTLFRYSQPIIIRHAIIYVSSESLRSNTWTGHGLVITAVVVYVGLAISTTAYQHRLNKLRTMIRGVLVALIHDKTMESYDETAVEGRVLTLVSTDVDSLDIIGEFFHETWGQVLEVIVGLVLLSWEVGWLSAVPLLLIFPCSRVSQYVARNLRSKMGSWNVATQSRISMTSAAISAIKNVKMLGLQDAVSTRIQGLRQYELHMASKVRWMMVAYNASANALGMFAPVVTLVLYAILARLRGGALDTETAFTSIAILIMITHPANMVMTIVPRVVASFASFERIQSFLLEPPREDHRLIRPEVSHTSEAADNTTGAPCCLTVESLCVGQTRRVLDNINLTVRQGSINIISGPTAAGKTLLARSILSEVSSVGTIAISSKRIAYCSQLPWLPNGSIRQIVTDFATDSIANDPSWYDTVINDCCLAKDIQELPNRDETIIGSRGINLSGGQRQRLALARAIFSRADILILDDPFSALDGRTESQIVESLLGSDGLLRKLGTTVLLICNSTQYFHLSDKVIILKDGRIKEQGKWDELISRDPQILKVIPSEDHAHEAAPVSFNRLPPQQESYENAAANLKRKTGDSALYSYYLEAAGLKSFVFMVSCTALYSFFITFPQYWLKLWTESNLSNDWLFIGGYIALNLAAWISTNGQMWSTVIHMAPHSGLHLHNILLKTVISAPLQYFSGTDTGSILNLFSQDLQLVDRKLPNDVSTVTTQVFKLLVQVIVLFVAQKLLALTLPICLIIVYIVQKVYLRSSRQLRLLGLESRSIVLTDFLETVDGLSTIRAFGGQSKAESEHIKCLDESQKPFYLLLCLQCWLRIVLDLLAAGIAVGVIALAVVLRDTTSGGQIGVALNIVLVANTTLLRLIESWTNLETSLGAIARIKSLEDELAPEDQPTEIIVPPEAWPTSGAVDIKNLTASYNAEHIALDDISLKVRSGQKVAICGRTGSGKSSLLLSLLRLLDAKSGSIVIDGVNIGFVPRLIVRGRCFATVSQEPLLLNQETLRFNLDPTETLSNDTIIEALSKVQLWEHFNSGSSQADLGDTHTSTHPTLDRSLASLPPLSVGQGQFLALARALLQVYIINTSGAKPIILLDEATSSLDSRTEELILDITHKEFTCKGHTMIMVTHRVGAAISHLREDVDIVVWMKNGKIEKIGDVSDVRNMVDQTLAHDADDEDVAEGL